MLLAYGHLGLESGPQLISQRELPRVTMVSSVATCANQAKDRIDRRGHRGGKRQAAVVLRERQCGSVERAPRAL